MALWGLFKGKGHDVDELARRLGVDPAVLKNARPAYTEAFVPKRHGKTRRLLVPAPELKALQRNIYRGLLKKLKAHPCATGFEAGHSIVSNAAYHAGRPVVVCMDIKDFFPSTRAKRVQWYFRDIGWNREAAALLTKLCTHEGGLPQGAPTSPRLSNLVNLRLDALLAGFAHKNAVAYSRYADDITFSFPVDDAHLIHRAIRVAKTTLDELGYTLHQDKKLRIRRRHQRQVVTGLVVNEKVQLPRATRRWLRAVNHRARTGRETSLDGAQLRGWQSFAEMIERQRSDLPG